MPREFSLEGRRNISKVPDACSSQRGFARAFYPDSKILDVGCGCLRAGYWLIRLLDSGCYFGIEPHAKMLQAGIDHCLTPALQELKRPRFDTNDRFDFSIFGVKFDVVLARSIWSHASKNQIKAMLDSFAQHANPNAFFLTSYLPHKWFKPRQRDYRGGNWVGKSHERSQPGKSTTAENGSGKNVNIED